MICVAFLRTIFLPRPAQASSLQPSLISLEIGVGFLQFGIFSLFILLVRILSPALAAARLWNRILALASLQRVADVAFLLRSEFGTKFDPVVRITPPIAYIIAVAVWLATFLRPEPIQPRPRAGASALTPEQMITELRRHTKAVKGISRKMMFDLIRNLPGRHAAVYLPVHRLPIPGQVPQTHH